MSKKISRSRDLQYSNWDDVLLDAENLLKQGYTKSGNWMLGQAASHIAQWTLFPIDGYPNPPFLIGILFYALKSAGVTKRMRERILRDGFQPGSPTIPSTVPPTKITDKEGVHQLKNAILKAKSYEGTLHPSPLFGKMTTEKFERVSLLHAAHHLSFFAPKPA